MTDPEFIDELAKLSYWKDHTNIVKVEPEDFRRIIGIARKALQADDIRPQTKP